MDIKTDAHHTSFRGRNLIFLDIESTGLEVQKHEIIEIGALKISPRKPFKILGEFSVKVKPMRLDQADKEALKIVHYSDEQWQQAVILKDALKQLDGFAQDGILSGYNVNFDWAILDKAYFNLGRQDPFYYHRLDVMPIAFAKLYSKKSIKRFSLGELCRYFGINEKIKHQALDDARATYLVFKKLMELK